MNILFVCTGNTCRSPMAHGYLKSKNLDNIAVNSAGLCSDAEPISQNSAAVLKEKGIDMTDHISRPINRELIEWADKIICLSPSHRQMLLSVGIPDEKVAVLGDGIPDPFGCDINVYRACRDKIFKEIDALFRSVTVKLSQMSDADVKNIANIERLTFSSPWSENAIIESHNNGTLFFTAEIEGEFAGYCGMNTVLDEGYITNIAVLEQYRRNGVACALLKEAEKTARQRGLSFISLEVRISNTAAKSLYTKLGYEIKGERKNFYTCPKENALIMTKRFENEDTQH